MKRAIAFSFIVMMSVGGCAGLSEEQKARVEAIVKENEVLAKQIAALLAKAKAGEATPVEIVEAVEKVRVVMDKNRSEIKAIQESGATWSAIVGGVVGTFGRTILHGVASSIPASGPLGAGIQAILTLLLGGSETKKKAA